MINKSFKFQLILHSNHDHICKQVSSLKEETMYKNEIKSEYVQHT